MNTHCSTGKTVYLPTTSSTCGGFNPWHCMNRGFWKPWKGSSESLIPQVKITEFITSFKDRIPMDITMAGFNEMYNRNFMDCNIFTEVNIP